MEEELSSETVKKKNEKCKKIMDPMFCVESGLYSSSNIRSSNQTPSLRNESFTQECEFILKFPSRIPVRERWFFKKG